MYKLDLEKAKEPEIKSPISVGSQKKQRNSREISTSASLTMLKPSTVWITTNCGKFFKRWEYQTTLPASWETCVQVKKQRLQPVMEQWTGSKLGKEHIKAVQVGSKGEATCPTTCPNPSCSNPSWLSNACTTRKDPESEWLARVNPETNPITIKPKTGNHMAEQFSWVPLPSCSLPRHLFPIKSLALSACVSPQTTHFHVLYKSPLLGPGRGPPFYNRNMYEISVHGCMLSCFSQVQLFVTLWTVACQARLSMEFSRQFSME